MFFVEKVINNYKDGLLRFVVTPKTKRGEVRRYCLMPLFLFYFLGFLRGVGGQEIGNDALEVIFQFWGQLSGVFDAVKEI
jgi:hypothetical protein